MRLTLPAQQPFIFHNAVRSHGWYQMAPFEYNEEAGLLGYVLRLESGRVLELTIRAAPGGIRIDTSEKLTRAESRSLTEKITWMFGLEMDFTGFYEAARHEPKLAHVQEKAYGRVLRSPTFFEDVLKTILTTNTLWAATKRMNLNLINTYGESEPASGKKAFPTPAAIAASNPEMLKEKVRVGYRAPSIHELAVHVASGELDIDAYKNSSLPTLELRAELMKIKGVGPYAAANLLMILGRGDFIPVDSWALKLASHEWYDGAPATPAQVEAHFEKWGKFKGLAYWFWDWSYKG
jgi:3-methyladenine DNA glycosylase/8-oxoguanine DNA glycosylase